MKKFLVLTAGMILIASPVLAEDTGQQHLSRGNSDYFKHSETKTNSQSPAATASAYDFSTDRSARIANESGDYFKKVGDHGPAIKMFNKFSDKSEYPFPHSRLDSKTHAYTYIGADK
jgi:hypothetical protein